MRERDSKNLVKLCLPFLSLLFSVSSVWTEYVCSLGVGNKLEGFLLLFILFLHPSFLPTN